MKKTLLAVAIIMASITGMTAAAQSNNTISEGCTTKTECVSADKKGRAFEGLNLTDAQKTQIEALRAERKAAKEAVKAKAKGEKAAKLTDEQRKQCREDFNKKLQQILTPEQYKQYTDKQA